MRLLAFAATAACSVLAGAALAQSPPAQPSMPGMPGMAASTSAPPPKGGAEMAGMPGMDDMQDMDMSGGMHHGTGQLGAYPMTRDASGTAWQPDSAPHDGLHIPVGDWTVMAHGAVTAIYDDQGGPRGDEKTFALSHFMVDASRSLGGGVLTLRSLFSLDPLMGKSGYPLLLQTGETADGRTRLIDRQHPHDLIGELAAVYSHPITAGVSGFVYGGPAGEPALGPAVYLHRAVGMVDPETPIDHHWLDSTHLAFGVVTAGLVSGGWKVEASSFTGREPNQNRWDIEHPHLDSWSARLTWNPASDWSLQVSRGRLNSVEQLEPNVDQDRTTASATYNRAWKGGNWQTVFAWGRIDTLPPKPAQGRSSDAYLLESVLTKGRDTVFARFETVDKDELFEEGAPLDGVSFNVSKFSLGYQRSFPLRDHLALDLGGLVSRYDLPKPLDPIYGDPTSVVLFSRFRITG